MADDQSLLRDLIPLIPDSQPEPVVTVLRKRVQVGVEAPGTPCSWLNAPATYDWRCRAREHTNTACVKSDGIVATVHDALARQYPFDAHVVGYVLVGPDGQIWRNMPRINKGGLSWVNSLGFRLYATVLLSDYDNPKAPGSKDKLKWTPEMRAEMDELWGKSSLYAQAGRWFTTGGLHTIQPLTMMIEITPLAPGESITLVEKIIALRIWEAWREGIRVDERCNDWTRYIRAPHVIREDKDKPKYSTYAPGVLDTSRMAPVDPRPLVERVSEWVGFSRKDIQEHLVEGVKLGDILSRRMRVKPAKPTQSPKPPAERKAKDAALPAMDEADGEATASPEATAYTSDDVIDYDFDAEPPKEWAWWIEEVGAYIQRHPSGNRHYFYRDLSGALLHGPAKDGRLGPLAIPAVIEALARREGANDPAHHRTTAEDTLRRCVNDSLISGMPVFEKSFGSLARYVAFSLERGKHADDQSKMLSADAAYQQMKNLFNYGVEPGVLGCEVTCGGGKSQAFLDAAAEKAEEARRLVAASGAGSRPKIGKYKSAIGTNSNALAIQHYEALRAKGVSVARVFSPVSVPGPHEGLECHYGDYAKELANAGMSVPYELCNGRNTHPCPHRDTCAAYGGREGDENPIVMVGTQWMLSKLVGHVGKHGVIALDEMRSVVDHEELTHAQLSEVVDQNVTTKRYGATMGALAHALALALPTEPETPADAPRDLLDMVRTGAPRLPTMTLMNAANHAGLDPDEYAGEPAMLVIDAARLAFEPKNEANAPTPTHANTSCPVRERVMMMAEHHQPTRERIISVSKTFNTLWKLLEQTPDVRVNTDGTPVAGVPVCWVRRDEATGEGSRLATTRVYPPLFNLLRSSTQSRLVILDASMESHKPVIEALTPAVRYETFDVADGAEVRRSIVLVKASRKAMRDEHGQWVASKVAERLKYAIKILERTPWARVAGLATYKPLAMLLRHALGEAVAGPDLDQACLDPIAREAFCAEIRKTLKSWPGEWRIGHYGAMRGLNHWKEVDATVTLGDDRPNVDAVARIAAYVGTDAEKMSAAHTRAEGEQVHGRGRAPRRTRPLIEIHVGEHLPGGAHWKLRSVEVFGPQDFGVVTAGTRQESMALVESAVAAVGGTQAELARRLGGVSREAVRMWMNGMRVPSEENTSKLLEIVTKFAKKTP